MLQIEQPSQPEPMNRSSFALFRLGFRPFYLLASSFAALSVVLWVCQYAGYLPTSYLRGPAWHGHEMLFGYTLAVIVGFLFTAVRTWSGQDTPTGLSLALYAALWIAGRIMVLTPYPVASAVVNAAFPILAAIGIGIPLWRGRNKRNYFFVVLLLALGVATLAQHLAYIGVIAWPERISLQLAIDLVLFVIAVIAGRVLPMFTNNGVPGANAERHPMVEKVALGSVLALLLVDVLQAPLLIVVVICAIAAAAHGARLMLWKPWRTGAKPLVWILHAAYGWIVIHLVLRALEAGGLVAHTASVHALTLGVIGGMTIGMMTRTARGHTGRALVADKFEIACYVLVMLAAVTRVLGTLFVAEYYVVSLIVSGVCWSAAFALYAVRYAPILCRPRLDGKPG